MELWNMEYRYILFLIDLSLLGLCSSAELNKIIRDSDVSNLA